MPTAAAVAAAAATAKIQAMDAVATNAVIGEHSDSTNLLFPICQIFLGIFVQMTDVLVAGLSKLTAIQPTVIPAVVPGLVPTQAGVLPPPGIAIPQAIPVTAVGAGFRAPTPIIPG